MAHMMGQEDTKALLNEWLPKLRTCDLHFDGRDASVIRTGSDHGADWYVVVGLVEANHLFGEWVIYVEASDAVRFTVLRIPDLGDRGYLEGVYDFSLHNA